MESRISQRKTYLIEIMYYENHNTEVTTITTDNINWSMTQYQRNRKAFLVGNFRLETRNRWKKIGRPKRNRRVSLVFSKAYLIFISMIVKVMEWIEMFKKKKKPTASELQSNIISESTSLKSKLISMFQLVIQMFKKWKLTFF